MSMIEGLKKGARLTDEEIAILWAEFGNQCEAALHPDSPDFRNTYRAESIKQWPGSDKDCYFARMAAKAQQDKDFKAFAEWCDKPRCKECGDVL